MLEGGQRSQDGTSDPYAVLTLGRSNDLDLHGLRGKSSDLLLHPVGDTREHGATSRKDSVGIEILTDVNVTFHD